jgi:anti-anti-sigma regulatory factor
MGGHVVEVGNSITVRSAASFQSQLLSIFQEGGDVALDLESLAELDLSFVQIVEAARKQFAGSGRDFGLLRPAEGAVAALLARAGFATDPDAIDFWFHGELPL